MSEKRDKLYSSAVKTKRYYKSLGTKVPSFIDGIINGDVDDINKLTFDKQEILSPRYSEQNEFAKGGYTDPPVGPVNKGIKDSRFNNNPLEGPELLNPDIPGYRHRILNSRIGTRKNTAEQEGDESSHIMMSGEADGRHYAYPSLYQNKDQSWYTPKDPFKEAVKKKELYGFDTAEGAERFAKGSWKPNEFAEGGYIDPPVKKKETKIYDKVSSVKIGKDFTTKWFAHPETRKRYRANMNEMAGYEDNNLGRDNNKFRDALLGIKNAKVSFKEDRGTTKGGYNEPTNDIYFFGDNVTPGTATHEYTHAAGDLDHDLSRYTMQKYGLLKSLRDKHPGLSTNEAIQKEFSTNGDFSTSDRLKHAEYMGQNGEIYPRFMEMRQFLNVEPGQPIDDDMIRRLMNDQKVGEAAKYYKPEVLKEILNTIADNSNVSNTNTAAYGGKLQGTDVLDNYLNEYNNGGSHETNPHGGIPQGMGSNGKQNTVEEDETSFNIDGTKYIFSRRLKL